MQEQTWNDKTIFTITANRVPTELNVLLEYKL